MKAVILAAGFGSRLKPLTDTMPKCLVKVLDKNIIAYQIESYLKAGVDEIIIVTGYLNEVLNKFMKENYSSIKYKIVYNKNYNLTNNMYSLYLVKNYLYESFLLSNADVIFTQDMARYVVESNVENGIAVESGNYNDESMKIVVKDGMVKSISKNISKNDAYGTSIDLYKIGNEARVILFDEIEKIINQNGELNSWTEVALNNIMDKINFMPIDIGDRFWYEIDNHEDLKNAEMVVKGYKKNE